MALSKITDASVTNSTLTTTKLATPNLGRRNVLINGGMNVSQRNGTTLTATANNSLFLDRWKCYLNGPSSISTQQMLPLDSNVTALNTASGENYNNVMSIDCTTASAIQSSDLLGVIQLIEGSNSVPLAGQSCTLSFWVKSSVTGQYYVTFKIASARSYIAPYTISSANTWEKKTITITMDTLASLNTNGDTGNGAGFQVYFGLRLGSSAQATSTVNQWVDGNFYGTLSQVTWGTNVSDTFYIGAVQLELGTAASPFEHRSVGEELELCKRYFNQIGGQTPYQNIIQAMWISGNTAVSPYYHRPTLRATPIITKLQNWGHLGPGTIGQTVSADQNGLNSVQFGFSGGSGGTSGISVVLRGNNNSGVYITFDAEL